MDDDGETFGGGQVLPAHIEETVQAIGRLHARHREGASRLHRVVQRLTGIFSRPQAAAILAALAIGWIAGNEFLAAAGLHPPDPRPYAFLGVTSGITALLMAVFILITQRREDELSELREQLTLELAILSEQKAAKVIQLLEELRRDLPNVKNRFDAEAGTMAMPADPEAVLEALRDTKKEEAAAAPPEGGPPISG